MGYLSNFNNQTYILLNEKDYNGQVTSSIRTKNAYGKGFWKATLLERNL
jgi:hypothetical protein